MMTKQTEEALKMAIEALEDYPYEHRTAKMDDALQACKEALEQPSAQEPIGYIGVMTLQRIKSNYSGIDGYGISLKKLLENDIPLYTHPAPSRQGLREYDILSIDGLDCVDETYLINFARAIEAKLKEKNT